MMTPRKDSTQSQNRFFWRKLMGFTLPFAIGFSIITGFLMWMGESTPLQVVAWMQAGDTPVLFRPGYGYRDQEYKHVSVETHQPDVMILGSSRVLQFRGHLLTEDPQAFYNASAAGWKLDEIERLLTLSRHKPQILILSIDPPWFAEGYTGDAAVQPPTSDFSRVFITNRTFLQDVINGRDFDFRRLLSRDDPGAQGEIALGMRAIIDGHGYRNDGSERYGDFLVAQHLWQPHMRANHLGKLENCDDMYICADSIYDPAMTQLAALLDYTQSHEIQVIGLLPPYAPSQWDAILASDGHSYIPALTPQLQTLFAAYDYPFFDYSDGALPVLQATDDDFFDGWHHSEKVAARMFIDMARQVPALAAYSDLNALEAHINNAPDTFRVFDFIADKPLN